MKKLVKSLSVLLLAGTATLCLAASNTANVFTAKQTAAIGDIIHNYLVKNPEVLVEAMQAYQKQQQQSQASQALPKIKANAGKLFDDTNSPVSGNAKGATVLVEFYDFRCPHCKDASRSVEALIKANPNLKVISKDFPIFGGSSLTAAKASIAAYKLDPTKYTALHNNLMHFAGNLSDDDVMTIANKSGYDTTKLSTEMKQSWVTDQIKADMQLGTSIGVNATPMFVIGNEKTAKYSFVPGAFPQKYLQKQIDAVSGQ